MYSRQYKVKVKDLLALLIIFIFFPPEIIERLSDSLDTVQKYIQIAAMVLLLGMTLRKRGLNFSVAHVLWGVFCLYGLGLTVYMKTGYVYLYMIKVGVPIFSAILVCMYYKAEEGGMERLIRCMAGYWAFLIMLNALCMLLFPSGIIQSAAAATRERANWLFGSKNNIVAPMIFAACFICLAYHRSGQRGKIKYFFVLMLLVLEMVSTGEESAVFMGGSATGIVAIAVLLIFFLFWRRLSRTALMKNLSVFLVALIFLGVSALVIYGSVGSSSLLGRLFAVLGKDITASGRVTAWTTALAMVLQSPVKGYGYLYTMFSSSLSSCYNFYLDCVFRYGLIGLLILFVLFAVYKRGRGLEQDPKAYMFLVGIICMFICGVVNTMSWVYLALLLECYSAHSEQLPD
jgi:hypothetical protein